jgi:hypothetical protein
MNKVSDEQIHELLTKQVEYLKNIYTEDKILGIFVYGNANYGFAESLNEVHTVFCYIPSFEEMCFGETAVTEYIDYGDTKIRKTDIRLLYHLAISQDDIIMESIFSDYHLINPRYKNIFNKYIYMNRETMFHSNQELKVTNSINKALRILKGEQLSSDDLFEISRIRISARLYLDGVSCENCINIKKDYYQTYLWSVKHGELNPDINEIESDLYNMLKEAKNLTPNVGCQEIIKNSIVELMRISFLNLSHNSFIESLTNGEKDALKAITKQLGNQIEGNISISQLTQSSGISRPVFNNLLSKMKNSYIAEIDNQGVKGTYIKILDNSIFDIK